MKKIEMSDKDRVQMIASDYQSRLSKVYKILGSYGHAVVNNLLPNPKFTPDEVVEALTALRDFIAEQAWKEARRPTGMIPFNKEIQA